MEGLWQVIQTYWLPITLSLGGLYLITRPGALACTWRPPREAARQATQARGGASRQGNAEAPMTIPDARTNLARLALRRAELEQEIAALERNDGPVGAGVGPVKQGVPNQVDLTHQKGGFPE